MKSIVTLLASGLVPAWCLSVQPRATPGGTGPYPASWTTDPDLVNHTIYAPANPPSGFKLPVIVWGETGCSYNGRVFEQFLTEVASHGIFIIANGPPDGKDNPNGIAETNNPVPTLMVASLDWISKVGGTGKYANVDKTRIAAAGQSCGGVQAYTQAQDPRVGYIGIFNSGETNATNPIPSKVAKPIFYFLGGSTDIAYTNGERDYTVLPAGTPRWKGNMNVGHMATYYQVNGGKFGVAASRWAEWLLRGNTTAASFFTGTGSGTAQGDGWSTVSSNLASISVTPIN